MIDITITDATKEIKYILKAQLSSGTGKPVLDQQNNYSSESGSGSERSAKHIVVDENTIKDKITEEFISNFKMYTFTK